MTKTSELQPVTLPDKSRQPRAVWAITFAVVGVFMGIGIVSPILRPLATEMSATPAQVSLLFTGYMAVMGLAMIVTGAVSSRIGVRNTLLLGLFVIAVCALGASVSGTIGQVIGFRAGWGLGNALFVATALAAIVAAASATSKAITYYESAVGVGIAMGPLIGGVLGQISWRTSFLGSAALIAVACVLLLVLLPRNASPGTPTPLVAPFRALAHPGLLSVALVSLLYHLGLFTLFAYTPFVLGYSAVHIGFLFSGWGVCLVITSVYLAPRLRGLLGAIGATTLMLVLFAATLAVAAVFTDNPPTVATCIVVSGLFVGPLNTLVTEIGMDAAPVEGGTAAAAYSFVRFGGGAIAPWLATWAGEATNPHVPFAFVAGAALLAVGVLALGRRRLPDHHSRSVQVRQESSVSVVT
ncbi:MFS transporter [Rhodococcus chondri]|uniref:MFS transporter n=1 Tax=Rhodococcus chondri TaxID=3065941 RepID=A0ABU7JTN0_9NOCA|nr:MFS transporter [Rhodococcus sp. CC-R104]MEE2033190.1 MFS transporter [Rhodococcus sp. CC-R104]